MCLYQLISVNEISAKEMCETWLLSSTPEHLRLDSVCMHEVGGGHAGDSPGLRQRGK